MEAEDGDVGGGGGDSAIDTGVFPEELWVRDLEIELERSVSRTGRACAQARGH